MDPQQGLKGDGSTGVGRSSEPKKSSLEELPAARTPGGMQLALHLAQRRKNRLLTFLEFGLYLVIPPWLAWNTFFSPSELCFSNGFSAQLFF